MTPKQQAELEIYLAAGFDFPTAMAMIQPDEEGAAELEPAPQERSEPVRLSGRHYLFAFLVVIVWVVLSIWLFGG